MIEEMRQRLPKMMLYSGQTLQSMHWEGAHCLANKPVPPSHMGKLGQRSQGCDRKPPIMGPARMHSLLHAYPAKRCQALPCDSNH